METAEAYDFESFRQVARGLVARDVAPIDVTWKDARFSQQDLFAEAAAPSNEPAQATPLRVPRRYVELAERAVMMRTADRFALAYRVLHRLTHGEPRLMDDVLDADVHALTRRSDAVRNDEHRMHAFVRFRPTPVAGGTQLVAWYAPQHFTVRLAAPFFARRLQRERFAILTPDESAFWDGESVRFGPGAPRTALPHGDELEELFRAYYHAVYNPARRNLKLFDHHVPASFRRDMPELQGLPLASGKLTEAVPVARAEPPRGASLAELAVALRDCRACELGALATHGVAGEGPLDAKLCLIGEQPGDEEDLQGRTFVGPAGHVLDRALREAGIARESVYLTNAVKHFRFERSGKRRLHVKPQQPHIKACKPWLAAELAQLKPDVVVCLGATAAQAVLQRRIRLSDERGQLHGSPLAPNARCIATFHPSAILRAVDDAESAALYGALVEDLRAALALIGTDRRGDV